MDMISLKNIEKTFQTDSIETAALSEISMDIKKGEFISVMGPSGCGKSTLLSIIGLLDIPTKGQVLINNESPLEYKDAKLSAFRNKMLGFVFQSFHLINDLSVIDNVELPLLYRRISGSERKQKALAALGKVGLSNRIDHYPSQLSGGQKQRVAIARAIVGQPEIILEIEHLWLSADHAVALALIVNELASNSLLHGRPPSEQRLRVRVQCRQAGDEVCVVVCDNGGGLPAAIDWGASTMQGLSIVSQLAQINLRGTLEMANRDGGLCTELRFDNAASLTKSASQP